MSRERTRLKHEYFLLGLLYRQPRHGYDLMKAVQQSPGLSAIWFVKPGRIYALLDRLEKAGMITAVQIESHNAPSRKQYSLTQEGETAFLEWVMQPVRHGRDMRLLFPARLYFALQLGKGHAQELIAAQSQVCTEWLEAYQYPYRRGARFLRRPDRSIPRWSDRSHAPMADAF